jgi:hypothetical protein
MKRALVERLTGLAGVAIGVASFLLIPLYFTYAGPPPASNVLTRNLIGILLCALLIVFLAGLSHLIRKADATYEWIASVLYGAGMTWVAVLLVGMSLEVGAIYGTPDGTIDPTIDGPLAHGTMLIHGSIGRALTALILTAAGYVILRTRLFAVWIGRAAYVIALINVLFIPSLYFGSDAARFYSAVGWGNSALVASLIAYWCLAVGVSLLRRAPNDVSPSISLAQTDVPSV